MAFMVWRLQNYHSVHRKTYNGVKTVCSVNGVGKMSRKMKIGHLLTPCTRINSKWIKGLNLDLKTMEILEENIKSKILDISHSNIFF